MFDTILIAVDGSDCAHRAAKHGLELAARYDAAVDVVTVYGGETERGNATLDEATDLAADVGVTVETDLLSGKPAGAIAEYAAERGTDLVVVGRRGRSGVRARLLGSVTERVLRRSPAPVLTVPPGDVDDGTGAAYGDVLVTTDGSEVAAEAAPYGADLARRFGAAFHALNVVDVQAEAGVFDAGGVDSEYIERLETRGHQAVDELVAAVDVSDLDVRRSVVRGRPHEAIDEYVREDDVDLVVMSSEGQSNLAGQQLGTVAGRVLRTVDRPVLVVTAN
ncbi:universal stress protein [Haloplanus salinarum]|uniref:universal stress protein n=1 Tax=Haloplanus salinarum TaxID=1912324 RepID=UPI00214BCDF3|nr:universal stress protein [Haloplanus salinarum]